jgi:hypothetical protein
LTNHVPLKDRQFEILQKKEDKIEKLKVEQAKRDYLKDPENFDAKFQPNCDHSKKTFKHLVNKKAYVPTNLCESGVDFSTDNVAAEDSLLLTAT